MDQYIKNVCEALDQLDLDEIKKAAQIISECKGINIYKNVSFMNGDLQDCYFPRSRYTLS